VLHTRIVPDYAVNTSVFLQTRGSDVRSLEDWSFKPKLNSSASDDCRMTLRSTRGALLNLLCLDVMCHV